MRDGLDQHFKDLNDKKKVNIKVIIYNSNPPRTLEDLSPGVGDHMLST